MLIRANDAEFLPASGVTLLADAADTGGLLTSNRSHFAIGSDGAPPHSHTHAAELFFVLDGKLEVLTGEEIHVLGAHDMLVVPPGVTHAFAPAPGATADVLFVYTPSKSRFDYYRLLERVYTGAADVAELAETQERFDNNYAESTVWVNRR